MRPWKGCGQFCSGINCNNARGKCGTMPFFSFPVDEEMYVVCKGHLFFIRNMCNSSKLLVNFVLMDL